MESQGFTRRRLESESNLDSETIQDRFASLPHAWTTRRIMRFLGQFATSLSLVAAAYLLMTLSTHLGGHGASSSLELTDTSKIRPAAFVAEEIFVPKALLAKVQDRDLRDILRKRDAARLDRFLEANGLRDAWFLVRYRGIDSEGSTWQNRNSNFEWQRYQLHSSSMKEMKNLMRNLDVLSRAISRIAGNEPDAMIASGQAEDDTVRITHFDKAKIYLIPDEATSLSYINQGDIEAWRNQ